MTNSRSRCEDCGSIDRVDKWVFPHETEPFLSGSVATLCFDCKRKRWKRSDRSYWNSPKKWRKGEIEEEWKQYKRMVLQTRISILQARFTRGIEKKLFNERKLEINWPAGPYDSYGSNEYRGVFRVLGQRSPAAWNGHGSIFDQDEEADWRGGICYLGHHRKTKFKSLLHAKLLFQLEQEQIQIEREN